MPLDPYNVSDLYQIYDHAMDAEEADFGECSPGEWCLDLGDGLTVTRMTKEKYPHAWEMGNGNFVFHIDGHDFAFLGTSMVHDQLHILVPAELAPYDRRWHQACNRLLEANDIPFRLVTPTNFTISYPADRFNQRRLPLMRTESKHIRETDTYVDVEVGTNFMAKMHGGKWHRCAPGSDEDYHINYGLGLL